MTAWMSVGYDAGRLGSLTGFLTETGTGGVTNVQFNLTDRYAHWVYSQVGATTPVRSVDPLLHSDFGGLSQFVDVGGYRNFGIELADILTTVGNGTYTVVFDPSVDRYTISLSGAGLTGFTITGMTASLSGMLGVSTSSIGSTGATWSTPTAAPHVQGSRILHWCRPESGGWSEWTEEDEDIDGESLFGADGSVRGLTAIASARRADFVAAWEPERKIRSAWPGRFWTTGSTWSSIFARARCAEPIWISPPNDLDPFASNMSPLVGFFRQDAAVLRPRLPTVDYSGYQTVPFGIYIVGLGTWYNQA